MTFSYARGSCKMCLYERPDLIMESSIYMMHKDFVNTRADDAAWGAFSMLVLKRDSVDHVRLPVTA